MCDEISKVDVEKMTFIGTAGGEEQVYYDEELNQVTIVDETFESAKVLTHEEFIEICNMREKIEQLAN